MFKISSNRVFHFTWLMGSIIILLFCNETLFAQDWTEKYLPRLKKDSTKILERYYGRTRKIINLNGPWEARISGEEIWYKIEVPGVFDFEGEVDFKRTFKIDSSLSDYSFQLVTFGIGRRCKIIINGVIQGEHTNGHTIRKFDLDKENILIAGLNEIKIQVNNFLSARSGLPLKHHPRMSRNFGGIFRDIYILATPKIHFDDLSVKQKFSDDFKQCRLEVQTVVINDKYNTSGAIKINLELWDADRMELVARSSSKNLPLTDDVLRHPLTLNIQNIKLWSPDNPKLYELKAFLRQNKKVMDELKLMIGFRDFAIQANQFLLNGHSITLKGVDWFENYSEKGPIASWDEIKNEVVQIKEIGVNTVRIMGTPPHPYFLDMCDQMGLLVLQDSPFLVIPNQRFADQNFVENARLYISEVIKRNSRHVSVAALGLGSDLEFQKLNTQRFLHTLKDDLKQETDLLAFIVFRNYKPPQVVDSADFVICEGYGNEPNQFLTEIMQIKSIYPHKPIIASYGYPLIRDSDNFILSNHKEQTEKLTDLPPQNAVDNKRALKLQQIFLNTELNNKVAGLFVHTFSDWFGTTPNLIFGDSKNPFINRTGLVNLNRMKRMSFEVVQKAFNNIQKPIQFQPMTVNRNPTVYPVLGLALILTFLINFNRSRRFRGNLRRIFLFPHGFYTELRDKRKVSSWHSFLLSFITGTVISVILSSIVFKFRKDILFNDILDLLIETDKIKLQLIKLIWQPLLFVISFIMIYYLIYFMLIVIIKILSFLWRPEVTVNQLFTLTAWTNASFIWLLPIIPIYSRLINQNNWAVPAIILFILFILWSGLRIYRGFMVLLRLTLSKVVVLSMTIVIILSGALGWYYNSSQALFDYIPLYWSFIDLTYF